MKEAHTTAPTLHPEVDAVLRELVSGVEQALGDQFVAAYLQGSLAVGDFDEYSDVDFVIVTDGELTDSRVANLQSMHARIYNGDSKWAKRLEGSYFPGAVLRDCAQSGRELWYLDNGSSVLVRSNHCNKTVIRWILRERGVVLSGPEPSALIDPITAEDLRGAILASINGSWEQILANPEQFKNRFYQSFIVLHFCRKLHDLVVGAVGSKRVGAEWAKRHLGQPWIGLIERAWEMRTDPEVSIRQAASEADFDSTLEVVREVIRAAHVFASSEEFRSQGKRP